MTPSSKNLHFPHRRQSSLPPAHRMVALLLITATMAQGNEVALTPTMSPVPTSTSSPTRTFSPTGTFYPTTTMSPTFTGGRDIICGIDEIENVTDCEKVTMWLNDQILQAVAKVEDRRLWRSSPKSNSTSNPEWSFLKEMILEEEETMTMTEARHSSRKLFDPSAWKWLDKHLDIFGGGGETPQSEKKHTIEVYLIGISKPRSVFGNLRRQQMYRFMEVLNWGFRHTPFEFIRKRSKNYKDSLYYECWQGNQHLIKNEYRGRWIARGRDNKPDQLFIYICDNRKSNYIGWSSFPNRATSLLSQDGVFIRNPGIFTRGAVSSWEIYATLVHEVGHWLGLLHTFEGGCHNPETQPRLGDGVNDTKPHKKPSWEFSDYLTCFDGRKPPQGTGNDNLIKTCGETDPTNNFMNYIDGWCSMLNGEFTDGQVIRMENQLVTYRRPEIGRRLRRLLSEVDISDWIPPAELLLTCKRAVNVICECDMDCASKVVGVLASYEDVQREVFHEVLAHYKTHCLCDLEQADVTAEFLVTEGLRLLNVTDQEDNFNHLARKCFVRATSSCDFSTLFTSLYPVKARLEGTQHETIYGAVLDEYRAECPSITQATLVEFAQNRVNDVCNCTTARLWCPEKVLREQVLSVVRHFAVSRYDTVVKATLVEVATKCEMSTCGCRKTCTDHVTSVLDRYDPQVKQMVVDCCNSCDNATQCGDPDHFACGRVLNKVGRHCVGIGEYGFPCQSPDDCKSGLCTDGYCRDCDERWRSCNSTHYCTGRRQCLEKRDVGHNCYTSAYCQSNRCVKGHDSVRYCVECKWPKNCRAKGTLTCADNRCVPVKAAGEKCRKGVWDCKSGYCYEGVCSVKCAWHGHCGKGGAPNHYCDNKGSRFCFPKLPAGGNCTLYGSVSCNSGVCATSADGNRECQ